ncbi:DUF2997 domain-containing protein [Planctomicrobium sp. SH527]|uniref:DUF2997 domain-containing protein n=1 Tax=Planctomicrobium sp. SH527 TaxID=3448123 RepID=UPI003F5CA403
MSPFIEVIIAPDGASRVETKGYSGNSCREASQFLQQALGRPTQETLKPEFYQTSVEADPIRQQV